MRISIALLHPILATDQSINQSIHSTTMRRVQVRSDRYSNGLKQSTMSEPQPVRPQCPKSGIHLQNNAYTPCEGVAAKTRKARWTRERDFFSSKKKKKGTTCDSFFLFDEKKERHTACSQVLLNRACEQYRESILEQKGSQKPGWESEERERCHRR